MTPLHCLGQVRVVIGHVETLELQRSGRDEFVDGGGGLVEKGLDQPVVLSRESKGGESAM